MDKKYLTNILLYVILGVVAVFLILFVLYHLFGWGKVSVSTRAAQRVTAEETIESEGYLFRSESVLYTDNDGQVYGLLTEGANVKPGDKVAAVYHCSSDLLRSVKELDESIELLSNSAASENLSSIETKLKNLTSSLRNAGAGGDLAAVASQIDELQTTLNRRKSAIGSTDAFKTQIASLKAAKEELLSIAGGEAGAVYANKAGNYFSACDGYETLFDADGVKTMSIDEFLALPGGKAPQDEEGRTPAGKIVTGSYWYLVSAVSAEDAVGMVQGRSYSVELTSSGEHLTMTLDRLVIEESTGRALLVFGSRNVPQKRLERCEDIKVVTGSYTGLLVPTAALRYRTLEDGKEELGVFVKEGSKTKFKKVVILCQQSGYYVVKEMTPDLEGYASYLAVNEVIVTSGKNMSEGYREYKS